MRNGIWNIPSDIRRKFFTFFYRHVNASPVCWLSSKRHVYSDTSALFFKLKLCFKVLEFESMKILTGSKVTAQQGVCWQLFQQPLRVFAVALMLPGGPRLVPATLAQWQALSHFAQKTKKKTLADVSCAGLNTGPQLWCDPALHSRSSWMAYLVTVAGKDDSFIIMMSWKWVLSGRPLSCALLFLSLPPRQRQRRRVEKRLRTSGWFKRRLDNKALWLLIFNKTLWYVE